MPCYDPPTGRTDRDAIDTMTRLACMYCTLMEAQGRPIPEFARQWWIDHKAYDAMRSGKDTRYDAKD